MKSDPKDCLYCQNNETLHNLMIEIAPLSVSRVFLFKEQTYRGRCLVAYKDHVNDLFELRTREIAFYQVCTGFFCHACKDSPFVAISTHNGSDNDLFRVTFL